MGYTSQMTTALSRQLKYIVSILGMFLAMGCTDPSTSSIPDGGVDGGVDGDILSDITDADGGQDATPLCIAGSEDLPRSLEIPGADPNGIYDPDLEWDPQGQRMWLSYSSVEGPAGVGKVSTHLAYSEDRGMTWCFAGVVNPSTDVPREDQPESIAQDHAHWSHETSALFYDADAPQEQRWSLTWHRYLHVEDNIPGNEDRHFEHGWIAIKRAASPMGLLSAPEEKLFSSLVYHVDPVIEDYNNAAPGGLPIKRFDTDPLLGDCLAFAEPGISAHSGRIHAALFCFRTQQQQDIVLVTYDHSAQTWSSVGTLLTTQDAQTIHPDLLGFNAPDIYETPGGWRLMVTPTVGAYLGCIEYGLDIVAGSLVDSNGDGPDPLYAYEKNPDPQVYQTGACTYHHQSETGVIVGDVYTSGVQFRLIATGDLR
ncbi:hypothetical protein KKF84_07680 [Myxococcota bacterium]|nr:hypothetical protein [Myxococcota bacterium]MBU1535185.1 hypothetical protein [Myxococcota bacterium]